MRKSDVALASTAKRFGGLVFRRDQVAGQRRGIVGKFAQHVAGASAAFDCLHLAAAHQRGTAELVVGGYGRGRIGLVAFRIADDIPMRAIIQ